MKWLPTWIEGTGAAAPWLYLALFLAASFLIIWRLDSMNAGGFEGTALGTLIMPYCSGIGNLMLVFVIGRTGGPGSELVTNALVNNVTNMTLLIGLPALIWGMRIMPAIKGKRKKRGNDLEHRINRLSLLLSLTAVLFFTGALWIMTRDGRLDSTDGVILIGLFAFWQTFHVFDVLKSNVRRNKSFSWMLPIDLALLAAGACGTYVSIEGLVLWLKQFEGGGFLREANLGWLSGWLMVLPNALLALYYGWKGNPEIVYTSQVGDGHICIPLCVGLYAFSYSATLPAMFHTGMTLLLAATAVHFLFVAVLGGLPRFIGALLIAAYGFFLFKGLL